MRSGKALAPVFALSVGFTTALASEKVEFGKYLSSSCVTCHRIDGTDTGIPSIVGWDEESFVEVLKSYKTKERENKAMQTIAAPLTKEDMEALAAYFATLKEKE